MYWREKFAAAISGVVWSLRTQRSFWVHLPVAVLALTVAAWLGVEPWRWIALILAITLVLTAELLNTSLEELVKVIHPGQHDGVGRALDIAAGAVLVATVGAVLLGLITLGPPLWRTLVN